MDLLGSIDLNGTTTLHLFITVLDVSGTLILPEDLITIENEAFSEIPAQKIIISNNCTNIGNRAFAGSDVVLAVIPGSVTSIMADAFDGCPLLTVITDRPESAVTDWCNQQEINWYMQE